MPLLAYCITEPQLGHQTLPAGVQAKPVVAINEAELCCFVSQYDPDDPQSKVPVREAALAFSRLLQSLLPQGTIIPFRFPTLLADEDEVAHYLREHASEYREALARLRGTAQMEITLSTTDAETQRRNDKPSGRKYLESRRASHRLLEAAAQQLHEAAGAAVIEWRTRDLPAGTRAFALIRYSAVQAFVRQLESEKVPREIKIRISGPWPPTEFVKEN